MKLENVMISLVLFLAAIITGCATVPTREVMLRANYGLYVNSDQFENIVRNKYEFSDPYSAFISCTAPRKGWAESMYGYISTCRVNAKNPFGAYVGEKDRTFLYIEGKLSEVYGRNCVYLD